MPRPPDDAKAGPARKRRKEKERKGEEKKGEEHPNALVREKERFLCPFAFRNALPALAPEPKLLKSKVESKELAAFHITDLERELRPFMYVDGELTAMLNPFEITKLATPANPPPMHPDDAALLSDDVSGVAVQGPDDNDGAAKPAFKRVGNKPKTDVQWLFRTQYIAHGLSADGATHGTGGGGLGQKRKSALAVDQLEQEAAAAGGASTADGASAEAESAAAKAEAVGDTELAAEIRAIDASFRAANGDLPKPPRPGVKAVSVMPVLPDESWFFRESESDPCLVHVVFVDDDPFGDERTAPTAVRNLPADKRSELSRNALAFPYNNAMPTGERDRGLALCVPRAGTTPDIGAVGEYDWIREYAYSVPNQLPSTLDPSERGRLYRLMLPNSTPEAANKPAFYAPMVNRLELRKKKKVNYEPPAGTMVDNAIVDAMRNYRTPRPSVVTVTRTQPTEAET